MTAISLLLPVRITEEKFDNFIRFFETLDQCLADQKNVEVCIKFDDDQDLTRAIAVIEKFRKKGLQIKYLVSPRGKGYGYFSYFMNDLSFIADPESKAFCHLTIDFYFNHNNFDELLLEKFKQYEDGIFVVHQQFTGSFLTEIKDVNFSFQYVENAPIVSRKWLEIQGTYGYSSSCDGYIGMVEYFLFNEWGIDRRIDMSSHRFTMETDGGGVDSNYWQNTRRKAMEMHLSSQSIAFARQAAKNLALNVSNAWKKDEYCNYLINSCLNNYDINLTLEKNLRELKKRVSNKLEDASIPAVNKAIRNRRAVRRMQRIFFPPLLIYDKLILPALKRKFSKNN